MKNLSECEKVDPKEILAPVLDKRSAKRRAVFNTTNLDSSYHQSSQASQSAKNQSKNHQSQLFKLRDRLVDFILFWTLLGSFLLASWLDSLDQLPS